jgi:hypothetical protein
MDESQLPEFVHEEIHATSGGPDQLRQGLLHLKPLPLNSFEIECVRTIVEGTKRSKRTQ